MAQKNGIARWRNRLLLLAISVFLTLSLAECAFRVTVRSNYRRVMTQSSHPLFDFKYGAPFEYGLHPNARGIGHLAQKPEVEWNYQLNKDGFRGRPIGKKRPGVSRVLVIGDSYPFGWGMNEGEPPFPSRLETMLNADSPTTRVEVINAAVPGYGTLHEFHLLKNTLPIAMPDIVVWTFVMNDAEPQQSVPINPDVEYQYCWSWLWSRIEAGLLTRFPSLSDYFHDERYLHDYDYRKGFAPGSPKAQTAKKWLRIADGILRSDDFPIPMLLVIIPDFYWPFDDKYPFTEIHKTVASWGEEMKVETLDLWPYFKGMDHKKLWIEGDGHPNAEAHELIAKQIAARLKPMLDEQQNKPK